jgi:hypothetical protein
MASEQNTGPVAIWVSVPVLSRSTLVGYSVQKKSVINTATGVTTVTNAPFFLGWGETAPEPEFLPEYEPIMSDLAGSRKEHDRLYEGADARVTATMTVWNEMILQSMLAFTKSTSPPGSDGGLDIGTLMQAEKRTFQLWLVFPYVVKPFMIAANMLPGYHFVGACLDGPIRRGLGTKVNRVMLSWFCGRPILNGFYACYDFDMSAVATLKPDLNRPF